MKPIKHEGVKRTEPLVGLRMWRAIDSHAPFFESPTGLIQTRTVYELSASTMSGRSDALRSTGGEVWTPVMKAECRLLKMEVPEIVNDKNHKPPVDDCICGIYSAKLPETHNYDMLLKLLEIAAMGANGDDNIYAYLLETVKWKRLFLSGQAIGYVNIWGTIIEHEYGYRSEYAQVKSLFCPSYLNDTTIQDLISRFECEIYRFDCEGEA